MKNIEIGGLKVVISWLVVFALRLIPHRIPNIEGVMATIMPFSKRFGVISSFVYGALSIALYDFVVGQVGSWTISTSVTYGIVGVASALFFRNRKGSRTNFVIFAIVGTLFYDAVTGVAMGPLLYGQPLSEAFFGQIPFKLYHLAGNIVLSAVVSPLLYKWVIEEEKLEVDVLWAKLFARTT
ncbi:MAG: hypothetical protein A2836_03600 [Candidatus Taylorbacteria bacterium RIFCSPHIGHO2_01_FULL_45_63]|uniref:Rod shape-determining protein MreD n=1 Tax=Candidatus Taylorbacteria bacterium RIFCSPHIGHO2_02_FULL_45_35 TaxID=1802311 RepID=A0A1G2MTB6_9BACT|nr:MAG: hypothetical protein A2836_03600 [Candidatus Taylorbacteria bacterium RIFCSPHIGHO2_01_FULL_45_63]OHA26272.1 MAG: hypothetical protein A3D56_02345 [Candidatus Taylorbacteria bacterium RIFCSPHIGHO2_02_FULL_45_35]OHA32833.1 MAG: hypothetical protein A3A22_02780 [Candidatus Taylorbacteria bacterium RIFCSPLOWO2_01_FULL_45_34b]